MLKRMKQFFERINCKSNCCTSVDIDLNGDGESDVTIHISDTGSIEVSSPMNTPNTLRFVRRLKLADNVRDSNYRKAQSSRMIDSASKATQK